MRVSVNLPDEVIEKADSLSKKMGLSRSAYISMLICQDAKQSEVVNMLPAMLDAYKNEERKMREMIGNSEN